MRRGNSPSMIGRCPLHPASWFAGFASCGVPGCYSDQISSGPGFQVRHHHSPFTLRLQFPFFLWITIRLGAGDMETNFKEGGYRWPPRPHSQTASSSRRRDSRWRSSFGILASLIVLGCMVKLRYFIPTKMPGATVNEPTPSLSDPLNPWKSVSSTFVFFFSWPIHSVPSDIRKLSASGYSVPANFKSCPDHPES